MICKLHNYRDGIFVEIFIRKLRQYMRCGIQGMDISGTEQRCWDIASCHSYLPPPSHRVDVMPQHKINFRYRCWRSKLYQILALQTTTKRRRKKKRKTKISNNKNKSKFIIQSSSIRNRTKKKKNTTNIDWCGVGRRKYECIRKTMEASAKTNPVRSTNGESFFVGPFYV